MEITSDRGASLDAFDMQVPRAGGTQLFDLFEDRGLRPGTGAILIRVTPVDNVVGAFASMIDNGTNDPILLTAGLATRG